MNYKLKRKFQTGLIILILSLILGWGSIFGQIQVENLTDNLYVIFGRGANVIASAGNDGILLVDTKFPEVTELLKDKLSKLSENPIGFVINTHLHPDHVAGNKDMHKEGAVIISHEKTREWMTKAIKQDFFNRIWQPADKEDLPNITFGKEMKLYYNSDEIYLLHERGHTDGDIIVYFKKANVIHLGDSYFNGFFPNADIYAGGSIELMIKFMKRVQDMIDDNTKVVPGHGPVSSKKELHECVKMMEDIRDNIIQQMNTGKTDEEIINSMPTKKYEREWKYGSFTPERMIEYYILDLRNIKHEKK